MYVYGATIAMSWWWERGQISWEKWTAAKWIKCQLLQLSSKNITLHRGRCVQKKTASVVY